MQRRHFLSTLAAAPALRFAEAQAPAGREYYELRRYHLVNGPQQKLISGFVADALIPALNRLGITPVGAFDLYLGPQTPALYLLLPSLSLEKLVTAEFALAHDDEYQRKGEAFLKAPAKEPPFERVESSLLSAFEGYPKLTAPPHGERVFQLRTYESPTNHDHRVKVQMFNSGEFAAFKRAGFWSVFYGDTLIGPRLPNLTYMISFPNLSELNDKWKAFGADPGWKKLVADPRFSYEPIVSNINNLILNPTSYSQI